MLAIRLQRTGRKHEPTFRVVLTDSKNGPKSGKYLETLGWYDSRRENKSDQMDTEKIKYWISKGAKPSVTLHNFLVSRKVIEGKKINALPKKTVQKKEESQTKEVATASAEAGASASTENPASAATEKSPVPASA